MALITKAAGQADFGLFSSLDKGSKGNPSAEGFGAEAPRCWNAAVPTSAPWGALAA